MSELKAIETVYNGYRFRSRLEARWAVFMDALGVSYQYEPEGFDLDGMAYLPDFWLPDLDTWLEIKPKAPNDREQTVASKLAEYSRKDVVILAGIPGEPLIDWDNYTLKTDYNGLLYTGKFHSNSRHIGWVLESWFYMMPEFLNMRGYDAKHYDGSIETIREWIELDKVYYRTEYGVEHPKWQYGYVFDNVMWGDGETGVFLDVNLNLNTDQCTPTLNRAYRLARQARFEYGYEKPVAANRSMRPTESANLDINIGYGDIPF